ncbi:hypothetical protein JCM10213_002586 [Rhodosporidiobolus nylandii]
MHLPPELLALVVRYAADSTFSPSRRRRFLLHVALVSRTFAALSRHEQIRCVLVDGEPALTWLRDQLAGEECSVVVEEAVVVFKAGEGMVDAAAIFELLSAFSHLEHLSLTNFSLDFRSNLPIFSSLASLSLVEARFTLPAPNPSGALLPPASFPSLRSLAISDARDIDYRRMPYGRPPAYHPRHLQPLARQLERLVLDPFLVRRLNSRAVEALLLQLALAELRVCWEFHAELPVSEAKRALLEWAEKVRLEHLLLRRREYLQAAAELAKDAEGYELLRRLQSISYSGAQEEADREADIRLKELGFKVLEAPEVCMLPNKLLGHIVSFVAASPASSYRRRRDLRKLCSTSRVLRVFARPYLCQCVEITCLSALLAFSRSALPDAATLVEELKVVERAELELLSLSNVVLAFRLPPILSSLTTLSFTNSYLSVPVAGRHHPLMPSSLPVIAFLEVHSTSTMLEDRNSVLLQQVQLLWDQLHGLVADPYGLVPPRLAQPVTSVWQALQGQLRRRGVRTLLEVSPSKEQLRGARVAFSNGDAVRLVLPLEHALPQVWRARQGGRETRLFLVGEQFLPITARGEEKHEERRRELLGRGLPLMAEVESSWAEQRVEWEKECREARTRWEAQEL